MEITYRARHMKRLSLLIAISACGGGAASQPAARPASSSAPASPAVTTAPASLSDRDLRVAQEALAEQYDEGKDIFVAKKCASCHGDHGEGNPNNPAVIGSNALPAVAPATSKLRKGVTFSTAKDVLDFVKVKMPLKNAGTLTEREAAAVTSWMLSESKLSIQRVLDASNAASVRLR
jgi:cytochrome c